jgi:hypothetical protein
MSSPCRKWRANSLKNPRTGRAIKKDGPVYKALEKECKSPKQKTPSKKVSSKRSISPCDKWRADPLRNPRTGRVITNTGPVYKALEKECKEPKDQKSSSTRVVRPIEVDKIINSQEYISNYETVSMLTKQVDKECIDAGLASTSEDKIVSIALESQKDFEDYNSLRKLQCALISVLHYAQNKKTFNYENVPVLDTIIRKYFNPIKQFGEESANGTAYKVGWAKGKQPICVMKIAKGGARRDGDLFHELAVGLALNSLRKSIPNFMYVFGGFYCNPPAKTTLKCNTTNNTTTFALFELVDGSPMKGKLDLDDFASVIFQVGNALQIANDKFKYMHYDLHGGNVLIRKLDKKEKIIIRIGKEQVVFNTQFVPQIIDYGFNSMMINGEFVTSKYNEYTTKPEHILNLQGDPKRYFLPLFDMWRYVSYVIYDYRKTNMQLFIQLWDIFIEPFIALAKQSKLQKGTDFYNFVNATDHPTALKYFLRTNTLRDIEVGNTEFFKTPIKDYLQEVHYRM